MIKYCESIFKTLRWKTRQVMVGNVGVGGDNPIRIQSMTTSSTRDVEATADQIMRLADSGCEIARVTVQGMKEADACEGIKNTLIQKGYTIPLVADIHFYPPAAFRAADFVDKVRINPGNYSDKRATFKTIEYTDESYPKELEKIEEKFAPLVEKCKKLNRSMRIGTNHGSLSDRIMNRYGDTPKGMVESALEFTRICRKYDYHDIIFSMKASNPIVMIQAYRLLVAEMYKLGWDYPLHLGVTEAGEGEDGRIKSAIGIGSLLLDGLGDTIRVSLTEDPWLEIDPCQRLVHFAEEYLGRGIEPFMEKHRDIANIQKRQVALPRDVAMHRDGTVFVSVAPEQLTEPNFYANLGCQMQFGKPKPAISSVDDIIIQNPPQDEASQAVYLNLHDAGIGLLTPQPNLPNTLRVLPLDVAAHEYRIQNLVEPHPVNEMTRCAVTIDENTTHLDWVFLQKINPSVIILSPVKDRLHFGRLFFDWLKENQLATPVILHFTYDCSKEDLIIRAATELGSLLADGLGDGVWIEGPYELDFMRNLSFNILQAARMRTVKTDFISCPSCGRTLFDLQEVTKKIRERTHHLPGVKIAIMGCIVNGPGEMADADFGYVGSKPGMIDLYVGKQCVEKDIPADNAVDRLVDLIKRHNRWVEPQPAEEKTLIEVQS